MRCKQGILLAALASLIGTSALPIHAEAVAPGGTIPWLGGNWYLAGADYPWDNYGNDFGSNAWGAYGVHSSGTYAQVDADFAAMAAEGIHVTRWWVFADGRAGITFDSVGMPSGIDQYVFPDLDAAVQIAAKHGVYLDLVLLDVSFMYARQTVNGVQLGGHAAVINTPAGQQDLLNNVFMPVFDRYSTNPMIVSWEVMNEPEWCIAEDGAVNSGCASAPSTLANFQTFTRSTVAAIHAHTASYATVGESAMKWAGQWKGLGLDYYQIHYYDWMHPYSVTDLYDTPYAALGLDAPVVVGEFPAANSTTAGLQQYLDTWFANGYAGAWSWSFKAVDGNGAPNAATMQAWAAGHASLVDIRPSLPGPPTAVIATPGDNAASVSWTPPGNSGASPITSYVVTAYDGCIAQGSMTIGGSPPPAGVQFAGLTNGVAYTFTVAAVNGAGAGPPSAPSAKVVPSGPSSAGWSSACSARQYALSHSDGVSWTDMDPTNLQVTFTPSTDSWAILTANSDLWTSSPGYNQDLGIFVTGGSSPNTYPTSPGQPEVWKESGGSAGTFSPNAATAQTAIRVTGGTPYTAGLVWKTNRADPGTVYAGAGPLLGKYSSTRLTIQLVPVSAARVFSAASPHQYRMTGSDGASWTALDPAGLSVQFGASSGAWMAYVLGNADLWTSSFGYNQDLGIAVSGGSFPSLPGQPEAWKESGGSAGTYSPNAAFVQASTGPIVAGTSYTATLVWKANRRDAGTIWAGAGPIAGHYSESTLTVLLVPATSSVSASTAQQMLGSSDGVTWAPMSPSGLRFSVTPGADMDLMVSAAVDLWTAASGYNQDVGIEVSGGAYGPGTVVAWKESGGSAGTYSPNAASVTVHLHLQAATGYAVWLVWKANRALAVSSAIWAGAGPIGGRFSTTALASWQLN